jgi:hypothetical protein
VVLEEADMGNGILAVDAIGFRFPVQIGEWQESDTCRKTFEDGKRLLALPCTLCHLEVRERGGPSSFLAASLAIR